MTLRPAGVDCHLLGRHSVGTFTVMTRAYVFAYLFTGLPARAEGAR